MPTIPVWWCASRRLIVPTGPTTLDAGRGPNPIIKPGGGAMTGGEWFPGDIVMLTNDGAGHWFLPGMPVAMLFANRDYYVSMTGSDTAMMVCRRPIRS